MLYNSAIYLPDELVNSLPDVIRHVVYCPHAVEVSRERNIQLPKSIFGGKIVEVEVENGEIIKALYRVTYSKNKDITMVFHVINGKPAIVRTLWLNNKGDHKNLKQPGRYYHG